MLLERLPLARRATARATPTRCFYMIGSMGLASSIGLGVALARPERRVIVFDGDGNVLMNLGTLATIAAAAPRNLLHVCFDNGVARVDRRRSRPSPIACRSRRWRAPPAIAGRVASSRRTRSTAERAGVRAARGAGVPARARRARAAGSAGAAHPVHAAKR